MDVEKVSNAIEQISQIYAKKLGIERDANWFILKLQEEMGELVQSYLMLEGKARTKGKSPEEIRAEFDREVADVFCHTLLLARFYGIDLEKVIEEKWLRWNRV
jgi:NTP pyrophosphatase (non-canonical NTP hydrolase)